MFLVFLGAVVIAAAPILVKAAQVGPTMIGFYRCVLAASLLLGWAALHRKASYTPAVSPASRWTLSGLLLGASLFFASDLFIWHRSVLYIGAGLSTILANTQVLYLAFLGILFFREAAHPRFLLAVPLALLGVYFLVQIPEDKPESPLYWLGVVYGLLAGLFYALFLLCLRRAQTLMGDPARALGFLCALTAGFLLVFGTIEGGLEIPRSWDWFVLFGLALGPQVIGWLLITKNLSQVPISRAGLVLLTQPVLATILGAWIYGERLNWVQIVGAVLTLTAIYLGSTRTSSRTQNTQP